MSPADRVNHDHAARAAGLQLVWREGVCKGGPVCAPFLASTGEPWRPLEDDGDALRLAVAVAEQSDAAVALGVDGTDVGVSVMSRGFIASFKQSSREAAARASIFAAAVYVGRLLEPALGGSQQPSPP